MKLLRTLLLLTFLFLASPALAAVSYDGTGDSHVVNNPNATAATYSFCLWYYMPSCQSGAAIFGYGKGNDSSTETGLELRQDSDCTLRLDHMGGTSGYSGPTLSTSTWHSICITHANDTYGTNFYYDATDGTSDYNPGMSVQNSTTATDDIWIGETIPLFTSNGLVNLNGRITQVAYWDVELTSAQVQSIANKTTCPTAVAASNLKAWLPMATIPPTEQAQSLAVTENGNPTLVADPSGLPCGVSGPPKYSIESLFLSPLTGIH